ncbi:MAG: rRNA small subunit methyltransferase [Ilumatobacteraceae bacterium]|nr:rRNA small subunit methyltransferase [Ilumatobacteraceae bacterium]
MTDDSALLAALAALRDRGALGESSLTAAVAHADSFVAALPPSTERLLDLGSGGGLPGLVIAARLPGTHIVLADRRERRMDLLRLAVSRLGWSDRIEVLTTDVVRLGRDPAYAGRFDAVTARAFGEPLLTARCAAPFLSVDGVVVVSEPPDEDPVVRWPASSLAALGLLRSPIAFGRVCRLERMAASPARSPIVP